MELLKDFNPKDCEDLSFQVPQSYNDQDMRGLILKNRNVSNKSELGSLITKLIGYISQMNNFKPKINWGEIEKTIESDFLNTDFS